jgi:hypothetical protein
VLPTRQISVKSGPIGVYHDSGKTTMPSQQQWQLSKLFEFLQKVKFGGIVGKKTVIAVAAIIACAVAMISGWGNQTVILIALGGVVTLVVIAYREINKTIEQLEHLPGLAIMDGPELLALKKAEIAAAKNMRIVEITPTIADPLRPRKEITTPIVAEDEE